MSFIVNEDPNYYRNQLTNFKAESLIKGTLGIKNQGISKAEIKLQKIAYTLGETIKLQCDIDNVECKSAVSQIKIAIERIDHISGH